MRELQTHETLAVGGGTIGLLTAVGCVAKKLHATAEYTLKFTGLQPIFSIIDKPLIHPVLWTPLAKITGVDVDSHPPGI